MKIIQRIVITFSLFAASTVTASAALCTPGSLQDYVNLGATGCEINDNFVVRDVGFAILSVTLGADLPDASEILVTPSSSGGNPGLEFTAVNPAAWATTGLGGVYEALLGFEIASLSPVHRLTGSDLSAAGDASGLGAANVLELQCLGGFFSSLVLNPLCSGGIAVNDAVDLTGLAGGTAQANLFTGQSVTQIDVIKSITLEGVVALGSGEISSIGQTFDAQEVPEPGTVSLLGGALVGFAWLRRKRRSKPTLS